MKKFNKTILLLTIAGLFLNLSFAFAQAPAIEWQKTFGGTADEQLASVQQTSDGGFILGGASSSNDGNISGNHGNQDYWIAKLDTARNIQWQKSLGGSSWEQFGSIQQTTDSGYIVAGYSGSIDGDVTGHHGAEDLWDFWIVKLNSSGIIQWEKSLGGSDDDLAYSVKQTADGGYIVSGNSQSTDGDLAGFNLDNMDIWLVKLDGSGNMQWQKTLGGSNFDEGKVVIQTPEGGYLIAGYTESWDRDIVDKVNVTDRIWIVKTDTIGNIQWQKTIAGYVNAMQHTIDGGYIVAGYALYGFANVNGNHGDNDYWILKLDTQGNVEWKNSYGGSNSDIAKSVKQTTDGGYIISGSSQSSDGDVTVNHGGNDEWVIKLDTLGVLQWQKSLGGTSNDNANSIIQTMDGRYVVAGITTSGDGDVTNNHGASDFWIVKLSPDQCVIPSMPSSITNQGGTLKVCSGDTRTYTTGLTAGVTYNWSVPTGAIINSGQGTNIINVTYNNNFPASGVISVVKVNSCGSSVSRNLTVRKNMPSIPSAINGPKFGLCGGRNIVYSVQQVQGMTYNWTVPGLAHIVSGQGTNSITVNFQSVNFQKTISVTTTNACGTSAVRTLVIRSAPEIPGSINGPSTVCNNSSGINYNIAPVMSSTNYTWTAPAGSHITANGITSTNNVLNTTALTVTVAFGTVTSTSMIKVRANNICGNGGTKSLKLTPCSPRLENELMGNNASIYPNPSTGIFTLHLSSNANTDYKIIINDLLGKEIINRNIEVNEEYEYPIDLQKINPSIYFLTVLSADLKQTIKIIKQ